MPNMTGEQMAAEMKRIRADIPIILCTGFSSRVNEEQAANSAIRGFLHKPILKREMASKIRELIPPS